MERVNEINIGDVKIWNFSEMATQYVTDSAIRNHITRILQSHIHNDKPIKDVCVASIGKMDFRQYKQDEIARILGARLVLFLAFLSQQCQKLHRSDSGFDMRTAENFQPIAQNFSVGDDHIAEMSGYIVHISAGGYKIGEKKFPAPSCIVRPITFQYDDELIKLLNLLRTGKGRRLYSRILQATELFLQSYFNNDIVSPTSRILLHAAAFETLLDLGYNARKEFKDTIEKYSNLPKERRYACYYLAGNGIKRRDPVNRSVKGIWAEHFYTIRNSIAHGYKINQRQLVYQNSARHFDISTLFFVLLVKKIVSEKWVREIFYDQITWEAVTEGETTTKKFIYRDLKFQKKILPAELKRLKLGKGERPLPRDKVGN
jgi:hypothetical protein